MATFVLDPAIHTTASVPRFTRPYQRRQYRDKHFKGGEQEWKERLESSTTVYVGNLSCYTNEYQLYELFSRCGTIKRIIMGLDKIKKIPCGFCFVEYDDRDSAMRSINYLNRIHLDGREIQIDIDAGFQDGRQYGRGSHGGQVSDERRRERDQGGAPGSHPGGHRGGHQGGGGAAHLLTRSITIVTCIAMISVLLLVSQPESVSSETIIRPYRPFRTQYANTTFIRKAQQSEHRAQFENAFAQFLVNLMKAAKPTLMKAFIQATLADKQLKEVAIQLFFNNTGVDEGDD